MMFIEHGIKFMMDNGLQQHEADLIMKNVIDHPSNVAMSDRWDEDINSYPEQFKNMFIFSIKQEATKWIDKNCPDAWFRPAFSGVMSDGTPVEEAMKRGNDNPKEFIKNVDKVIQKNLDKLNRKIQDK